MCSFCRAVVARGDLGPAQVGKLGTFLPTASPLELGRTGAIAGVPFELTGHAQVEHRGGSRGSAERGAEGPLTGGTWDEWYALLADGRWAWIAEAQGKRYLTFEVPAADAGPLPPVDALVPGREVLPGLVVAEVGQGVYRAAAGELPFRLEPGRGYTFADLSGPGGVFATIDYGVAGGHEAPVLFRGREVTLADLGLAAAPLAERAAPRVTSVRLACPSCDGSLDLVAPDAMKRVGCPFCGSLLDVREGALSILRKVSDPVLKPPIPLGAKGTFDGRTLTVAGWLERAVENTWGRFTWDELLLVDEATSDFRWLVRTGTFHWSYVEPVAGGDVRDDGGHVTHAGTRYRLFDQGAAVVDTVIGAFPWQVERGETTATMDYVAPPYMLSRETTPTEVTWSRGTWMTPDEVEAAFGGTFQLSPAHGVAPNQPWRHAPLLRHGAIVLGSMLVLMLLLAVSSSKRSIGRFAIDLEATSTAAEGAPQVWFSEPLELVGRKNVHVALSTAVHNDWVLVAGDLFDEATGTTQGFEQPIEYYSGVEGGESWTEGAQDGDVWLSAVPAGVYTLRLEVQRPPRAAASTLIATVEQGVFRWGPTFVLLLVLAVPIGIGWLARRAFEKKRWEESSLPSPFFRFQGGDDE